MLNTSKLKTSVDIDEEFGKNLYNVDTQKLADYKKLLVSQSKVLIIGEGVKPIKQTAEDNYIKTTNSFDKSIQPLMTVQGYNGILANRFNTLSTEFCDEGDYTCKLQTLI